MEEVEEYGSARKKPRFSNNREIDEDLHSAQLAVYGRETMMKLLDSKVLISGMQGLGVEIAKNIILAGVKSVTLHDENEVELWDLASSFVYSEVDVGRNRALASLHKLKELNNDVAVSTLTGKLTKEQLSGFKAVVFVDTSFERATEFDDYCHNQNPPIAFIKADVRGLFGSLFCDFGPHFTVLDVDGEKPHSAIIASVSNGNHASVSCVNDGVSLGFQDRDFVVFSEVEGMTELNDGKPRKINNVKPHSFVLDEDTTSFGKYVKGGIVTQVKQPMVLNFKPLREAIKYPGDFLHSDVSKSDRPPLLHLAFQALDIFLSKVGRFPSSEEDSQKLLSIATDINENSVGSRLEDVDSNVLRHLAFGSRAVLNPMAAMFGGIVGQEVVKACSGKFHPIFQFFYFDSLESLPKEPLDPLEFRPQNSRYDAQISVFGSTLQKKLENARVFVVGAGAHGCEFLKNLALMGVSCGDQGKLTVTDDDVIKKSNLGHQFLFRDWNIGRAKSTVAAAAAAGINSCLKIDVRQNRVGPETDNVFCDSFWQNLTVVVNALDNVTKRPYVESRCLQFQKPMLESETLGAKCNTHMVIPHITESYGASRDPPEKQAPMCTVHSFPHNIDHCLEWARSEFEGLFEKTPAEVNDYLSSLDRDEYLNSKKIAGDAQARDTLGRVFECLKEKCKSFQDCIKWARMRFEDYFVNRVNQLIFTFPENAKTSTGALFWSAPKRFPRPLQFSSSDPSHTNFVRAAAILRAKTFRIVIPEWALTSTRLAEAVNKVDVPKFNPRKDAKIVTDEKVTTLIAASVDHSAEIQELMDKLAKCVQLEFKMKLEPIQLEKDDDTNHHMDMIVGLANMRARNYKVPEMDKLKAKVITGRIIPAIATSTAMATGFVCLELYKVLDGAHKLEDYRSTVANLALPHISLSQPVPVEDFNVSDFVSSISKIDPRLPFESGSYTCPPDKVDLEMFLSPTNLCIEELNRKYSSNDVRVFLQQRGIKPRMVIPFGEKGGYTVSFESFEDLKKALAYEGNVVKKESAYLTSSRVYFARVAGSVSAYLIRGLYGWGTEKSEIEKKLKNRFKNFGKVKIFIPPQQLIDFGYMYVNDKDGKRVAIGEEAVDYIVAGKHITVTNINPTTKLMSIMSQISY